MYKKGKNEILIKTINDTFKKKQKDFSKTMINDNCLFFITKQINNEKIICF